MSIGFDLTQFGSWDKTKQDINQTSNQQRQQQQIPSPVSQQLSIEDALFKPIKTNEELRDEEGNVWRDKRPEDFKRTHWSIDKFTEGTRVIQTTNEKGELIYIDANGNLPVDPKTGEILLTAPPSTIEDKKNINYGK